MSSASKKQPHLFAAVAHSSMLAKKAGIGQSADKAAPMLKKAGGGPGSMMGHALSGTQLGGAENLIRKAQDRFTTFADGGAVKKPAGPSAKERREIRSMIQNGKNDAVGALRGMRSALISSQEGAPQSDAGAKLAQLSAKIAKPASPNPSVLYDEYRELVGKLQDESLPPELHGQVVDRLADIEHALEGMGINVDEPS